MKASMAISAVLLALALSACERQTDVVAVPAPGPTAVVPVPGPQGPAGAPGPAGPKGKSGGDTVVVVPPAKSN